MADKVISATLKVNTGSSVEDVNAVNKALGQTTQELGASGEVAQESTGHFNTLKGALGALPGPMSAVNKGVETIESSLKVLAANPIVLVITLLVAALYGLYKAFASTESGAEKIEQIFSGLGAIVTVIRDRILALAGAVISFFKGDFKSAIEQTKSAVTGVGDAITNAYTKAANATRDLQDAQDELNRTINVNRAQLERDLAATKELITDETASYGDRKKAINEVRDAEQKQTQSELDNANKTLKALQDKLSLDREDADLKDQVAAQQIKVYQIQEQQAQTIRQLNKEQHQIDMQQQQEANESAQKAADLKKKLHAEELQRIEEEKKAKADLNAADVEYFNSQLANARNKTKEQEEQAKADAAELEAQQKKFDALEAQDQKANDVFIKQHNDAIAEQKATEEAYAKFRIDTAKNVGAALGALADLIGKQTVAGKALAIAQATINTWLGVTEVLSNKTVLPEPLGTINKIASIVAVVAAGLSAVKQIVSVQVPGGGGGGSTAAGGSIPTSAPAPLAPGQTSTQIDQSSIVGIGDATSGRVYVLSQDVTHDQDRNERLNRAARLGG